MEGPTLPEGAAKLVSDALVTTEACGGALITVRADSSYTHEVIAAARSNGARFSITARMNPLSPRRSRASVSRRGSRSTTRTRSGTETKNACSLTPKSPR